MSWFAFLFSFNNYLYLRWGLRVKTWDYAHLVTNFHQARLKVRPNLSHIGFDFKIFVLFHCDHSLCDYWGWNTRDERPTLFCLPIRRSIRNERRWSRRTHHYRSKELLLILRLLTHLFIKQNIQNSNVKKKLIAYFFIASLIDVSRRTLW